MCRVHFSLGIILGFAERFFSSGLAPSLWSIALSWILVIGPIALFGMVLYPSRAISPAIGAEVGSLKHTYYFRPKISNTMQQYLSDVKECDSVTSKYSTGVLEL